LVEAGLGPIGSVVEPGTLHLLVANYPINCAEPWGAPSQHVHTESECDADPEHVDWELDLMVPPAMAEPGTIPIGSIMSTISSGKCGTEGANVFPNIDQGTLAITASALSAVDFDLVASDPLSDGSYSAIRCP
jgi:hypothetical protein